VATLDPRSAARNYASARQAYTESAVLTADPGQLVVLLYKGAVRFATQAAAEIDAGRADRAWATVRRAQAIVDELNYTLDMSQGAIAEQLRSIYLFCRRQLLDGALRKDSHPLRDVARLLGELCQSWERVTAQTAQAAGARATGAVASARA